MRSFVGLLCGMNSFGFVICFLSCAVHLMVVFMGHVCVYTFWDCALIL